ncbi:unnamed protein product [Symbiodinium microadriaticum]|nr:unnamed protein product [Symbiodinium microadriaticum]
MTGTDGFVEGHAVGKFYRKQVNQAQSLLESSQSVSLRALKREFLLDDESLEDLVEELVEIREVAELDGKILRWVTATSTSEATKEQGERRQLTVMFCDLVGSTELAQQMVKSESQKWFDLQCSQFTSGSAFQPMIDLQSSYFGLADTSTPQAARDSLIEAVEALPGIDPAEVVPYLLAILKLPAIEKYPILQTSTNEQRDRTLKAMLALISAMAKQSPTVMVLEDLHWCDPSTLEFLAKLIEGSQSQQLLLLATSRPDYKYPWDNNMIDLISLNKLSVEHTREMIRQAAGADVPESVIDELEKRSDGVPLFIGELTSNVVGSSEKIEIDGQITLKIDLDKLSIPTTLQDSLMAKLDKLGGAKLVAQYAATFGREFSFRLLQLVSEFDEAFLGESLGSLELAGVVEEVGAVPGSQYSFKHALLQDAAYESLLMSTRRKIHARIVEALQRYFPKRVESEPEVIARHCAAADLQNDAVEYYQRAAELAEQRLSNEEASLHYQSAIKALESQEVGESRHQREILLRLAQNKAITAMEGFETSAVHANTARIEALCNSFEQREQKLPALMGLLEFDSIRGNLLNSKDRAMELLEIAESVNLPIAIATANLILGGTDSETGKLKSAEQRYKLVIEMPISKQLPPPATSNDLEFLSLALAAYACTFATLCKFQQCYDTAQQCIQRALEYGNDATRANTYAMVSLCGFQMQDPYLVEQYADKAIDYSGGRGFHATETMAKILKGWSYKVLNNSADCVPQMEQGLQIAKQTGVVGGLPLLHCAAAETYSMCGDQSKAMQQVEEASNLANTNGAVGYVPWIMNSKARIMLAKDDCNIPEVSDLLMASYFMASEQSNNFAKFVAATRLAEIAREPQEIEISYQRLCDEIEELDENPNSLSWKDAREVIRPKLELPQNCSPEQRKVRQEEVESAAKEYVFNHAWSGYPPNIKKLPKREASLKDKVAVEGGFAEGIAESLAGQWMRYVAYEGEHIFRSKPPFSAYKAIYKHSALPAIADNDKWQEDAVFALQRLNGMFPWFIQRVTDLDKFLATFPIEEASIKNLIPDNQTLSSLADGGRLYYVSQECLEGATPAHEHVMTAPTTLFFVNDLGQLMPLGIQLYPKPAPDNPVFTPNDNPNTWLGVKIHVSCADTLVYSLYNHAVYIHFVMSAIWTSANRTLPVEHPVYAFLKPHFWMTLFVTNQVVGSMDKESGAQLKILGIDYSGQNLMVSRCYEKFDFRTYKPEFDFSSRGVNDANKLPNYCYRDDLNKLWEIDYNYVKSMMELFYSSDSDVLNDNELQAWMADLVSEEGAGLHGLPLNGDNKLETRESFYEILASILLTVTSRHSSIINSALQFGYVPANPSIYRLAAPQDASAALDLKEVSDSLPPISEAIEGRDLIASAAHFVPVKINALGHYPVGFTVGWPDGADANIAAWQEALSQLSTEIQTRNEALEFPYAAVDPDNTFNSIFN